MKTRHPRHPRHPLQLVALALLLIAHSSSVIADIEASPEDNNKLAVIIGGAFGAHLTGSVAGFVPFPPPVGIAGEAIAYTSDLTLKATPPVFERIPDKIIPNNAGACEINFVMDLVSAQRNNLLGFTFTHIPGQDRPINFGLDQRDWGPLVDQGEMFVLHLNSDVQVSVSNPNIVESPSNSNSNFRGIPVCEDGIDLNDDECYTVSLEEGIHPFNWQAQTLWSPIADGVLPAALLTFTIMSEVRTAYSFAKLTKKGAILEEILANPGARRFVDPAVANEIRLELVRKMLKLRDKPKIWNHIAKQLGREAGQRSLSELLTQQRSLARNRFTQRVTVWDRHTPTIFTTEPHITLEATDFGGTRYARVFEKLKDVLVYEDFCGSTLRLSSDAPNILPIGTGTITWTVTDVPDGVDPADYYAPGVTDFATVQQPYTVADTQPPILIAPPGKVVISSAPTVDPSNLSLGRPMVIDLADPAPTVINDAPREFDVDSRIAVNWTATDASGNADSKIQWVTAKSPGTNTAPIVSDVAAASRTSEIVELRLNGFDADLLPTSTGIPIVDPLSFKITDYPDHGEFVAPLNPFFIEDFRLTPLGESEVEGVRTSPLGANAKEFAELPDSDSRAAFLEDRYCDQDLDVPINFAYQPTYVHVADSGNYYIRDSFWECTGNLGRGLPSERERISKWSQERRFLRQYRLREALGITQSDIFSVDENEHVWWEVYGILGNVLGLQKINSNLANPQRLVMVPLLQTPNGREWRSAHGDPNTGLIYVNDNRGISVFGMGDLAPSSGLGNFFDVGNQRNRLGRLTVDGDPLFFPNQNCGLDRDKKFWMTTDNDSNLYVAEACQNRIHKFGPSSVRPDGSFVAGEYIGWLGRCSANVPPWSGCDEEKQVSNGYACRDDRCVRDALGGSEPGQFRRPVHIATDPRDILYVADFNNQRVQRFGPDGSFSGQAVSEGSGINKGDSPGFVLGNIGSPRAVAVNSSKLFVMQSEDSFDYFLHSFETVPFERIEAEGGIRDADLDGYEDNSVKIKYVSQFDFPGGTGQTMGQDSFKYRVNDGLADSAEATAEITVTRNFRPPEALELRCFRKNNPDRRVECVLPEDGDLLLTFIAKDPDGIIGFDGLDTLAYTPIKPAHGSLTLQNADAASADYLYEPDPDFNGQDTIAYTVNDGSTTGPGGFVEVHGEFEVDVFPVPDPPVITFDEPPVAGRGFEAVVTATYTDVDEDPDEPAPTLSINWRDGTIEAQGEIVTDDAGNMTVTGPLLTPTVPGEGFAQGSHAFDVNGMRSVQVCLQPADVPGVVCEEQQLEIIDATKVTVEVKAVEIDSIAKNVFTYDYDVEVRNGQPQGWDGLTATNVELLINLPVSLLGVTAGPNCQLATNLRQYRCAIGDLAPGEIVNRQVKLLLNPAVPPHPMITVDAEVSHGSVDISAEIESSAVVLVEWPDSDEDGVPDAWEQFYFGRLTATSGDGDPDGDGLTDVEEYMAATHPFELDTDGDGLDDFAELNDHMTVPNKADTDDDGLPDWWEVQTGVDPNSAADSLLDPDEDNLSTFAEFGLGTNPRIADTDADTHLDGNDNCPVIANRDQLDFDGDGRGRACDSFFVVDIVAEGSAAIPESHVVALLRTRQKFSGSSVARETDVMVSAVASGQTVNRYKPFDAAWSVQQILSIPSLSATAVSATRDDDGLNAIEISSMQTGKIITTRYPFNSAWRLVETTRIALSSSQPDVLATLGQREADGTIAVELLHPLQDIQIRKIGYFENAGSDLIPRSVVPAVHAGRPVLAVVATNNADGSTVVQARYADSGDLLSNAPAVDSSWAYVRAIQASNSSPGTGQIAILYRRLNDNLGNLVVVDVATGGPIRELALSTSTSWRVRNIESASYAGTPVFAVLMTDEITERAQIVLIDMMTGAEVQTVDFGPDQYRYRQSYTAIADANGNGVSEFGVVQEQIGTGIHSLRIKDGQTTEAIATIPVSNVIINSGSPPTESRGSGASGPYWLVLLLIIVSALRISPRRRMSRI